MWCLRWRSPTVGTGSSSPVSATPSGRPLIDRVGHANLYVNIGYGTLGLTLAAGSAELLADFLAGRPCCIDAIPLLLAHA